MIAEPRWRTIFEVAILRQDAVRLALAAHGGAAPSVKMLLTEAAQIETFLWGGNAPTDLSVTPLATLDDIAAAVAKVMSEGAAASPEHRSKIAATEPHWQRFLSEITMAITPIVGSTP